MSDNLLKSAEFNLFLIWYLLCNLIKAKGEAFIMRRTGKKISLLGIAIIMIACGKSTEQSSSEVSRSIFDQVISQNSSGPSGGSSGSSTILPSDIFAYTFALSTNKSFFLILKNGNSSGKTELLSGSGWSTLQKTILHQTDNDFDFIMSDYNGDGKDDLVCIKKNNTGTGLTEIHILDGASQFRSWLLQTGIPLQTFTGGIEFEMADYNKDGKKDLYAIWKENTGSGRTEVHIYSGADAFQSRLLSIATILHSTGKEFNFIVTDFTKDNIPDLIAVKKQGTGTNKTEIHVLNGATNFQHWILQTGTILDPTQDNSDFYGFDYNNDGFIDIINLQKRWDGNAEHVYMNVLDGADEFGRFLEKEKQF